MYLDRRLSFSAGSYDPASGRTTWSLPYAVRVDGTEGDVVAVRQDTGEMLPGGRLSETTVYAAGDYAGIPVYIGILYEYRYHPTQIYLRGEEGVPEQQGRLQLRFIDVLTSNTPSLTCTVRRTGRPDFVKSGAGPVHLAVLAENTQTALEITDRSPSGVRLVGLDWEGFLTQRARRF